MHCEDIRPDDRGPEAVRFDDILFGAWVETRTETCRDGRAVTVAVDRRSSTAMLLDESDRAALCATLEEAGFLEGTSRPPPPPVGVLWRFLRTLDAHWTGPDRLITTTHRRLARHAWRVPVLAAQLVLAVVGVLATITVVTAHRPLELRPSAEHVPLYVAVTLVSIAVHELGHGVVLAHYGRRVSAVGFRLHLGSPAFYVESVEALLMPRRQRMIQAAAGPWAEWQFVSVVAVVWGMLPDGDVATVLHRFVVLSVVTILTNLLPFAGLDGSLLFADLIREPHLAADSRAALLHAPRRRCGNRLLLAYAVANTIVSTLLLLVAIAMWYAVFGGILGMLLARGPIGWFAAGLVLAISFGPALGAATKQLRTVAVLDRAAFRFERRRRVRITEELAAVTPFDRLDERDLGIVAGQLHLHRIGRRTPLYEPGFRGVLYTDGPIVDLGRGAPLAAGVHRISSRGIAATTSRPFRRVRGALLPESALRVVGLDSSASTNAGGASH